MTSIASPAATDLVCRALRQPQLLLALTSADWDVLVRQARRAGLLARIACMLEAQGSIDSVPDAPRAHLSAAMILADSQRAQTMRELDFIDGALTSTGVKLVLLNGAAYVAGDLLPAMGRVFTGVDILVQKDRLAEVAAALMSHGWDTTHNSADDQRRQRERMGKLPPLRHIQRQTTIQLYHAILPEMSRSARVPASTRPLPPPQPYAVLGRADMVLHSITQLFHNEDLSRSLGDLSDLDLLLRHLGRKPDFWVDLADRAHDLNLAGPLHNALRYTNLLLGTPIPRDCLQPATGPGRLTTAINDWLWVRALRPQHSTATDRWTPLATSLLCVRAHWLRMPPATLLRHLTRKALRLRERGYSQIAAWAQLSGNRKLKGPPADS